MDYKTSLKATRTIKNKTKSPKNHKDPNTLVTICVLCYGNHYNLAYRCLSSLSRCTDNIKLFIGLNEPCQETLAYVTDLKKKKICNKIFHSRQNINKCPMMRQMFKEVNTKYILWLDDDSHIIDHNAIKKRLDIAESSPSNHTMWGHVFFFGNESNFNYGMDMISFVKQSPWYNGKEPPSWNPGGKDKIQGDGRWFFVTGGCWFIRTSAIQKLDWPSTNLIKRNDDVFLCEALRQHDLKFIDIGSCGIKENNAPRRGGGEDIETMEKQIEK